MSQFATMKDCTNRPHKKQMLVVSKSKTHLKARCGVLVTSNITTTAEGTQTLLS
jgi:microcystin degradation protein MlrC